MVISEDAKWLTVAEVARMCNVSRKTVYRAYWRGDLQGKRVGRLLRFDPDVVLAWGDDRQS